MLIAEMLIHSAKAADDLKIPYGSPAVQAGRALRALPSVDAAIAHAEQTLQHLRVLKKGEAEQSVADVGTRAAE